MKYITADLVNEIVKFVLIAFAGVGVIKWLTEGLRIISEKNIQKIIAWALLPIISFFASLVFDGGVAIILQRWVVSWATAQLIIYPIIGKLPELLYEAARARLMPPNAEGK
jgi:hypothetical protein